MLDSTPRVLDSSAELARVGLRGARLDPRLLDSSAESSNLGHESGTRQTDSGHESRTESDDRPPDSVRERGRELRQKCPTRDPHEGSSRTEFALWARSVNKVAWERTCARRRARGRRANQSLCEPVT